MAETTNEEQQQNDPIQVKTRIAEALSILKDLGLPRGQQNERSALTLLALHNVGPICQTALTNSASDCPSRSKVSGTNG
ncbi:MAG: hypothetical protein ACRDHZ_05980 [Ktedonobacteraceae bacterium]